MKKINLFLIALLSFLPVRVSFADEFPCNDLCQGLMGQIKYEVTPDMSPCRGLVTTPPKTVSPDMFKNLRLKMSWKQVCELVGTPTCSCGSGIVREVYKLSDGTTGMIMMEPDLTSWGRSLANGEAEYGDPAGKLMRENAPAQNN